MVVKKVGQVFLIGAGPGDPGLITVKGYQLLARAEVIVYDFLVSDVLLKTAQPEAELIYVGKQGSQHTMEQGQINRLLVKKAKQGKTVARLKGGDPFIFGRGGEEAESLKKHRVPFVIVPGITSAIAAPAYAGIPLTHRGHAASVAVVTGHRRAGFSVQLPEADTLVFLMGVKNLPTIVKGLLAQGKDPKTPVALVRWGTTTKQEVLVSTIKQVVAEVKKRKFQAPAVIVVGQVVKLRQTLNWLEKLPLFGQRIVVTRSRQQASKLSDQLSSLCAEVIEFPTIKIEPIKKNPALDQAIYYLNHYNYVIFTSQQGVRLFFERLTSLGLDSRSLAKSKVVTIGPATSQELLKQGIKADLEAAEFMAEGILAQLPKVLIGQNILIPRAAEAREVLPEDLTKRGAQVEVVPLYHIVPAKNNTASLLKQLKAREIDIITFASSLTVKYFLTALGKKNLKYLKKVKLATIGPITSAAVKAAGLIVALEAKEYTMDGLVAAIRKAVKK